MASLPGPRWAPTTAAPTDAPDATPPQPSATVADPSYPAELATFYTQKLDWKKCDSNECTTLTVPLDYAHPDGRTIKLAVLRAPATRRGERVGQLVVDPGGPGGSAVDYASSGAFTFGGPLTRYFDIVGMDPRGVGRSTPLECGDTEQVDEFVGVDPDPDTPAEVTDFDRVNREFGQRCLTKDAGLTRHMSTIEAAKDMDILRAALGERQLDYLGASYGTLLGATYADLFPHNIRRMVLDGALDPTLTNEQLNLGQARGFETALDGVRPVLRRPRRLRPRQRRRRREEAHPPAARQPRQQPAAHRERSPAHREPRPVRRRTARST